MVTYVTVIHFMYSFAFVFKNVINLLEKIHY
jgi:hypothetical protein